MNRRAIAALIVAALGGMSTLAMGAQDSVALKPVASGVMPKLRYYVPAKVELSETKPAGVTKAPKDLGKPLYGVLGFGAAESATNFNIIVDEPEGKEPAFYFDANGNGDLTDDPAVEWKGSGMNHRGEITVQAKGTSPAHLVFYRFDKNDGPRASL